jgi:hypothetical protein
MLGALCFAAALASADTANDASLAAALDLVYAGSTDTAIVQLVSQAAAAPRDPVPPYLEALALCWKAEQLPESRGLDADVHRWAERAVSTADERLEHAPDDFRSWLARGAAWGVRSRLYLFRGQRSGAIRAAVAMRADLTKAHALQPRDTDSLFGLGLYDYYADVLPRLARLLRFLVGYPGGNRARGLARIEAARTGSLWHRTEVEAQLYEIYAFYEDEPDRALEILRDLRSRYPGAPLWGLKLAEHLRERLGLYAQSAAVAREIAAAADRGEANYAPIVATLARLAEAEALVADLRPEAARHVLAPLLLAAAPRFRGGAPPRPLLERARAVEADPVARLLGEARRKRESGPSPAAAELFDRVLRIAPGNDEARLRVAEEALGQGRRAAALRTLRSLVDDRGVDPPFVRPWAALLLARALERSSQENAALELYRGLVERPGGLEDVRAEAERALSAR